MRKTTPIYCASCGADVSHGELKPCACGSTCFVSGVKVAVQTRVSQGEGLSLRDVEFLKSIRVAP